jgi:hypothetical protein
MRKMRKLAAIKAVIRAIKALRASIKVIIAKPSQFPNQVQTNS